MAVVQLDLEEGFFHDDVAVWAGATCLARVDGATTRPQVGLAGQVSVDVADGALLTVARGEDRLELTVDAGRPHVGVSVVDARMVARTAPSPFPRA